MSNLEIKELNTNSSRIRELAILYAACFAEGINPS